MRVHETRIDGKWWLDGFRSCVCNRKNGDNYVVTCEIHRCGWPRDYDCTKKADRLVRDEKSWCLTDEARKTVLSAIYSYERRTAELEIISHISVQIPQANTQIFLRRRDKETFDAVINDAYNPERPEICWYGKFSIGKIIRETAFRRCFWQGDKDLQELSDLLWRTPAEQLPENPFYLAAQASGDELLRLQIRLFYNLADGEDCRKLEKALCYRILPPLGSEFNRDFAIPSEEIDDDLLRQSGYMILHRPYFSMQGYTHNLWRINPHKKSGADAAKTGAEVTSFQDFLSMFEKPEA